jgi:type I restriction enzyme S subunit
VGRKQLEPNEGRSGYKKTLVGWIPEEWGCARLESLGAKTKNAIVDGPFGSNLKRIHYRNSGVPVIQSGFVTSQVFQADKYLYVDQSLFREQIRSAVHAGDIVMAKIGARSGTCAVLPANHSDSILAGNSLKISLDRERCDIPS